MSMYCDLIAKNWKGKCEGDEC